MGMGHDVRENGNGTWLGIQGVSDARALTSPWLTADDGQSSS